MKRADLTGQRFGRLVAVELVDIAHGNARWLFRCDCGNSHIAPARHVKGGGSKSCGCLLKEARWPVRVSHGDTRRGAKSRLYQVWVGIKQRCENPKSNSYRWYGARGVRVDAAWQTYTPFKEWALAAGYEPGLVIDRVDPDRDYTPSNCRWVTAEMNSSEARHWGTVTQPQQRKLRTKYNRGADGRFITN